MVAIDPKQKRRKLAVAVAAAAAALFFGSFALCLNAGYCSAYI
jgi:hypothetical protein